MQNTTTNQNTNENKIRQHKAETSNKDTRKIVQKLIGILKLKETATISKE